MKETNKNLEQMRHSGAHLLAAAVQKLYPNVKLAIGPAIDYGFYYDFDFGEYKISENDFDKIESEMQSLKEKGYKFEKIEMSINDAKTFLKQTNQPYSLSLLEDIEKYGSTKKSQMDEANKKKDNDIVTLYKSGDFINLCRGGHVNSFKEVGAFKITSIAGAYFRGSEKNPMLTRIYVACFPTEAELKDYIEKKALAEERDHKKIGRELELFFFHPTAPGIAYWLPKGLKIRNLLIEFWRGYHKEKGYQEISAPLINKKSLWEQSGHWDHYKDDMFKTKAKGSEQWALKPMNCPNAMNIFAFKPRSYRELPLRLSDTDNLFRDEIPGALNGLLRTRSFIQDDSHNFISEDQIENEIKDILDITNYFYEVFGLKDNVKLYLSTRPDDFMGDIKSWDEAEKGLKNALENSKFEYGVKEKDGAFYGPKIDIHLQDALGREWQCGTIQLDFQLPHRFNLEYTDKDGSKKTPIVVHRVIYGSLERFIGIVIEHFAGELPFWISPEQIRILTIGSDEISDYLKEIEGILEHIELENPVKHNGLRYSINRDQESLSKKIKEAQISKVPIMLIVGPKDKDNRSISVRIKNDQTQINISELKKFIETHK